MNPKNLFPVAYAMFLGTADGTTDEQQLNTAPQINAYDGQADTPFGLGADPAIHSRSASSIPHIAGLRTLYIASGSSAGSGTVRVQIRRGSPASGTWEDIATGVPVGGQNGPQLLEDVIPAGALNDGAVSIIDQAQWRVLLTPNSAGQSADWSVAIFLFTGSGRASNVGDALSPGWA